MNDDPRATWPRKRPQTVYIRFGRWSARSRNHGTGEQELGVSVCPATLNDDLTVSLAYHESNTMWFAQLRGQGRLAFPVTGRLVGIGSDGEPLLRGLKPLPYAIDFRSMPNLK